MPTLAPKRRYKLFVVAIALAMVAILQFLAWGAPLEVTVSDLVGSQLTPTRIAVAGIAALVLDVVLPIPSSIVSITMCLLLGPIVGACVVLLGMIGAFLLGYALGRSLPESRVKAWVGDTAWDLSISKGDVSALLWLGVTRPIPILAEVTAIVSGMMRVSLYQALPSVILSSVLVAAAYGVAAWVGLSHADRSMPVVVLSAAALPALSWIAYRVILRGAQRSSSR